MIEISGDSAEYEFITEGVALSAGVQGMAVEIGTRRGMGIKTIADAVRVFCPDKIVVSVDPYGHLDYEHREGIMCRLDYTNQMKLEGMAAIYTYLCDNPVNFIFENKTDTKFFADNANGIEVYDIETYLVNKYSFCHLDGPHGGDALSVEIKWFNERMDIGACQCVDDVSLDFINFVPIHELYESLGWKQIKIGLKKALYQKVR